MTTAMNNCEICDAQASFFLTHRDQYTFLRCDSCGHYFLHPMPTQDQLNQLYLSAEQHATSAPLSFPKAASRRRRGFLNALKFWRYVRSGKKALDLGCGGGFVAEGLRKMGGDVIGVDINEEALAYARENFPRCTFVNKSFHEMADQYDDHFDFIYSSEVIEHINELKTYMELLRRMTKKQGYVYITTPDEGSTQRPVDLEQWDVFCPPIHVRFFNEENLTRLFERYGFCKVKRYADKKCGLKVLFQKIVG